MIAGVWDYLIHVSQEEIMRLPVDFHSTNEIKGKVCQEALWLIGFWVNSGNARPCKSRVAWSYDNMSLGYRNTWAEKLKRSLASQVQFIRHWEVENKCYSHCENLEATWFIDPPYCVEGGNYRFGSKLLDYVELGRWCRERRGQVIVCENEGAVWLPFKSFRTIKGSEGEHRTGISLEAIWYRE